MTELNKWRHCSSISSRAERTLGWTEFKCHPVRFTSHTGSSQMKLIKIKRSPLIAHLSAVLPSRLVIYQLFIVSRLRSRGIFKILLVFGIGVCVWFMEALGEGTISYCLVKIFENGRRISKEVQHLTVEPAMIWSLNECDNPKAPRQIWRDDGRSLKKSFSWQ